MVSEKNIHVGKGLEVLEQGAGEGAEVHVSAQFHAGGGHSLRGGAVLHDQGHPFSELFPVFGILHPFK
jgi:hypothetical protein